jgi:DNA topoisomerase-1
MPRLLGERNDKPVKASIGRFGPYVQWGNVFGSIKDPDDPYEITLERAIELIEARQERDKARTLKDFVYDEKP